MKRIIFAIALFCISSSASAIKTVTEITNHLDSIAAQDAEGKNTLAYCENLDAAIDDLLGIGEGRVATSLVSSFLDSWKARWGMLGDTYTYYTMRQADILLKRGMLDVADRYITFVLDKMVESCDSIIEYKALVIAAEINVAKGDIKTAETQLDKAQRKFLSTNSTSQLYRIYGSRYEIAKKYGNMNEAVAAAKKQMQMAEACYGKDSQQYIWSLLCAYDSYVFTYNEDDSFLEDELLRVLPQLLANDTEVNTSSVALYYYNRFSYIMLYSTMIMSQGPLDVSGRLTILKNLEFAVQSMHELTEIFKSPVALTGYAHKVVAELAAAIDNYKVANHGMEFAYRVEKMLQGTPNTDTAVSYALSMMYVDKIDECTELLKNTIATATKQTLQNFRRMTAGERADYWNTTYAAYQRVLTAALEAKTQGEFPEIGYDILLLSKGLLLNSEMECKNLIESTKNSEVIELYNKWVKQKYAIDYAMQANAGNISQQQINDMVKEADELEQQLMLKSTEFGDFTAGFNITHTQVKKALKPGDVAIEFAAVYPPDMFSDDIYCAYVMTATGNIKLKVLGTLDDIKNIDASSAEAFSSNIYNEIWTPILSDIGQVKRVYFSPAGILNNIAIEYADGCEKYEFYRLSSTRELAESTPKSSFKDAIAYGGLKYNTDVQTLQKNSMKYPDVQRSATLTLSDRGDVFKDLSGAKAEVELIDKTLKKHNIGVQLFTDTIGTETSFKALSNHSHNLIHLATHGFYLTQDEAQKYNFSFVKATSQRDFSEDDMLKRSGLAFSGANNVVSGRKLPNNIDDGILTAYEIARLNLKDLSLVVLSACQTGLGDVTNDGVFGLQRGFKKAGAKSILMSLWKVNDNATKLLMDKFYANLADGMSKRQSLINAQKYVREYEEESTIDLNADLTSSQIKQLEREGQKIEPNIVTKKTRPFDNPKFWAAFILLDATD
jgi:CHAT domain-containing protein